VNESIIAVRVAADRDGGAVYGIPEWTYDGENWFSAPSPRKSRKLSAGSHEFSTCSPVRSGRLVVTCQRGAHIVWLSVYTTGLSKEK
jgi:hypothetical protein